jgi:hypothetical protein
MRNINSKCEKTGKSGVSMGPRYLSAYILEEVRNLPPGIFQWSPYWGDWAFGYVREDGEGAYSIYLTNLLTHGIEMNDMQL